MVRSGSICPVTEPGAEQLGVTWAHVTRWNMIPASWESLPPLTTLNYSSLTHGTTGECARVVKATTASLPTPVTTNPHTHYLTAVLEIIL